MINKLLVALRVTAALGKIISNSVLLVGIKLKSKLSQEVEKEHEEILKKYE